MGAGQIGGIATLVDMDFENAAGFHGEPAESTEAQYVIHYLSHAMMFCLGVLIEAHVVLTTANCVHGEKYKFSVVGGTHKFLEHAGITRSVHHLCIHKGYNTSQRWTDCLTDNLALLVLNTQFSFNMREPGSDFLLNRVRYGVSAPRDESLFSDTSCRYYGWGSRRNGYLIPLLINLQRMNVILLPRRKCLAMFNYDEKFLCIQQGQCRSSKFGALCPDDVGSVIVCSGFAQGIMTSRLVDRPCGVGFLDLSKYTKFLTCGVDDSRDVLDHDTHMEYDFTTVALPSTPTVLTIPPTNSSSEDDQPQY
ncbi:azurocidin [Spodoptera frugiperda]|uniref:Azurocidin n=1 Tax=Spodoptera frugiperda TaxID=7108 RepID=A0A9R0DNF5_SPOFR|nr:azurocidin [Spodoptera frugiperda]